MIDQSDAEGEREVPAAESPLFVSERSWSLDNDDGRLPLRRQTHQSVLYEDLGELVGLRDDGEAGHDPVLGGEGLGGGLSVQGREPVPDVGSRGHTGSPAAR